MLNFLSIIRKGWRDHLIIKGSKIQDFQGYKKIPSIYDNVINLAHKIAD